MPKPAISVAFLITSISLGLLIKRIESRKGERFLILNSGKRSLINFINLDSRVVSELHGSAAARACPNNISSLLSFPVSAGLNGVYSFGLEPFIRPVPIKSFPRKSKDLTLFTPVNSLIKILSSDDKILP